MLNIVAWKQDVNIEQGSMLYLHSIGLLLDCDQSNVLLARIIFFCILLKAFSFLSACIRYPACIIETRLILY